MLRQRALQHLFVVLQASGDVVGWTIVVQELSSCIYFLCGAVQILTGL